mgnify:CR=1 FL=1
MFLNAISKTLEQIADPVFIRVLLTAMLGGAVLMGLLSAVFLWFDPFTALQSLPYVGDSSILASAGTGLSLVLMWYFLYPVCLISIMSAMTDTVADAVEDAHYPNKKGPLSPSFLAGLASGLKLLMVVIAVNLLALIPYLFLLIFTAGVGTAVLFAVINGYLLGREYYETVSHRHMPPGAARLARKRRQGTIILAGALISGLLFVPLVNILTPILAAAFMTHIVHMGGYLRAPQAGERP